MSTFRLVSLLSLLAPALLAAGVAPVLGEDAGPAQSPSDPEPGSTGEEGSRAPRVWAPGEGERFWVFPESEEHLGSGGEFHVYLDPATVPEARASFARFSLGVGGALPEHRHAKTEEIAYFVSGRGVARLYRGGEAVEVEVGPGHVWYNPPGAWHSIRNTGDEPLVLVFATIPNEEKGLMSFFRKISVKPGEEPTRLAPEEFARIATEHDMILRPGPEEREEGAEGESGDGGPGG